MKISTDLIPILCTLHQAGRPHNASKGSVLVYLVVVILIFGILGVTMVSLFTTATSSSATPNDARRAYNMAESGMRYAFSELINSNFSSTVIDAFNTPTTYTVNQAGSFIINVFSPWFESPADQILPAGGSPLNIDVPFGNIPDGYTNPPNLVNVSIINFESINPLYPDGASAVIESRAGQTSKTLDLNLGNDDFKPNAKDRICLAVTPTSAQSGINQGGEISVAIEAQHIFPTRNGAVTITNLRDSSNIRPFDYLYDKRIDEPGNSRVRLTNLRRPPSSNGFPLDVDASTYVILSPNNYFIVSEGQSGNTTHGGDISFSMSFALNAYNLAPYKPGTIPADIDDPEFKNNISGPETDPNIIDVDTVTDTLDIGGSYTPSTGVDFGGAWYSGHQSIGGNQNVCNTGACLFGLGVRVFFTVTYIGDGDGFTYTIMNADPTDGNGITSIGGDPQGSELLAYAGDSREDPAGTTFLDNNGGRGIVPPKLAVEFDAKWNFDQDFEDDEDKNYCDGSDLRQDTRNDPLPDGEEKDAVQLVYWADRNSSNINIPCRENGDPTFSKASYDGNRHALSPPPPPPINERNLFLTDNELDVTPSNNWLNNGPWAVRLEVERSLVQNIVGNFDYSLRLWMRQCAQADCNDILGTFYQDTRIKYDYSALADLPLAQQIELSQSDHDMFNRFLFGFTTATAPGDTQSALIDNFNLSFIRPNDPVITNDLGWPPP